MEDYSFLFAVGGGIVLAVCYILMAMYIMNHSDDYNEEDYLDRY